MARIYRMDSNSSDPPDSPLKSSLVEGFIKFELIGGAFLMMMGGFVLRVQETYQLILIGAVLFSLGLFRLWQRSKIREFNSTGVVEDDRVLRLLKHNLNANYSLIIDYPLPNDEFIPYLILGPPGVFVLDTWELKGTVIDEGGPLKWTVKREGNTEEDDGTSKEVPDPVVRNKRRVQSLKDSLEKPGLLRPIHHYVILIGRRADDPPLQSDSVIEISELVRTVKSDETNQVLSWEDVEDLERLLGLKT
ncbi:MAG: nuclease-related domain-containing protein [bacterium]